MRVTTGVLGLSIAAGAVLAMACGGSDSPTSPSPGDGGGGGTGGAPSTATITISAAGTASPQAVTIRQGGTVTFVNNHSGRHAISSDPHPVHTDCPPINQVNNLGGGQTLQTGPMNTVRTCGFHDHDDPGNTGLQGTITVVQ
jgi:hypothetical protein